MSSPPKEKKIYFTFYHLYHQDFYPEEASIFRYLQYLTLHTPLEPVLLPKEETHSQAYHILLGKEELKDPVFLFSWIPRENIVFSTQNNSATFLNASMILMTTHRQDEQCGPYTLEHPHAQFPTFHLDFNTGKKLHQCVINEKTLQKIIDHAIHTPLSTSEPVLNFQPNQNINISSNTVFETPKYEIVDVEGLYFQLVPKEPKERIFIERNNVSRFFTSPTLYPPLFEKLSHLLSFTMPPDSYITCDIDPQSFKITQRAMIQHGEEFAQFYLQKHTQFKSILSKKYIMARYYIENLKHRNQEILQRSNLFPNAMEFQNMYYLGFDLEYFVVPFLQNRPHPISLIIPLICRIQGSDTYIVYYILINTDQKKIFLFYAFSNANPDQTIDPTLHEKIHHYLQHIIQYSFLSKSPVQFQFAGMPPISSSSRLHFLKPGHVESFQHLFSLFQLLLNPKTTPNANLSQDKNMNMFIDFLLGS